MKVEKTMDEGRAKKLLGQLDRDLSAFESISEWPDLNSWLSKLAKVDWPSLL